VAGRSCQRVFPAIREGGLALLSIRADGGPGCHPHAPLRATGVGAGQMPGVVESALGTVVDRPCHRLIGFPVFSQDYGGKLVLV